MPDETPTRVPVRAPVRIALCADDYALHPAVDAAVVRLAHRGRLGATSCMTTSPRWAEAARTLRDDAPAALSTGLHLNLTEGHGESAPTLGAVLLNAYTLRLDPARLRVQLARQFDAFEDALGRAPDFVDGHQHVHQLPGVREALFTVLAERYGRNAAGMPAVRATVPARWPWAAGKAGVLALLGGWRFERQLRRRDVPRNRGFAGVYGFDAATPADYGRRMDRWLSGCRDGTLMMCHPATAPVPGDAIAAQRVVEFEYLASDAFADSLRRHGVEIGGFPERPRL